MEDLMGFLTSKLALGIFSCALLCSSLLLLKNMSGDLESKKSRMAVEEISEYIKQVAESPWDCTVKISFLDRAPAGFVIRGESSSEQLLEIRDRFGNSGFLLIPYVVNGGDFEVEANNPTFIIVEKNGGEISVEAVHAYRS